MDRYRTETLDLIKQQCKLRGITYVRATYISEDHSTIEAFDSFLDVAGDTIAYRLEEREIYDVLTEAYELMTGGCDGMSCCIEDFRKTIDDREPLIFAHLLSVHYDIAFYGEILGRLEKLLSAFHIFYNENKKKYSLSY